MASSATATDKRASHSVSFDGYSFLIDGRRTYIWSGEFHPYRLPSPALWSDIFQKMKAAGFNTASIYFSWGYHSPSEGKYDFSGIRDMDLLLDQAEKAGIYVIARPGPYINAEVDSGGFPLWLTNKPVRNRSPDPAYLKLADEWLTRIDQILARHQLIDGRGSVIAYQVENEYYNGSEEGRTYMQHLEDKVRADGIRVPLIGNHNGTFVTGKGAVEVSGWDYYPQHFDCSNPSKWHPAPNMADVRYKGQPLYTAEFQGGAFDPWGGPGYEKCEQLINDGFANVFYKENIAAGATAQNLYMLYGGTSWGWQAIPQNYTSYDYGAAITEARQQAPKYYEDKRIGYFITTTPQLLKTEAAAPARIDDPDVIDIARINPDTRTQFHLIRHGDSTSTASASVHETLQIDGRELTIPQKSGTSISLAGRQSKLLVADYDFGAQHLAYSTSELMTSGQIGGRDFIVLYGDAGTLGETVLRATACSKVQVYGDGIDPVRRAGTIRLNYRHDGLRQVRVVDGGKELLLLVADRRSTERIWRQDTSAGTVLMIGSHLLRSASIAGDRLDLTGDGDADGRATIFSPRVRALTWNGVPLETHPSETGGLEVSLPTPVAVSLPKLDHWKRRDGAPEIMREFDDSAWRKADLHGSSSITKPQSDPVLMADDYGFHVGNTWYRAHFSGTARQVPTGVRLQVKSGGTAGAYSVWLNGRFLGTIKGEDEGSFGFPADALVKGDNVLSILTVNMGHEEDYDSKGENRTARGIVRADPLGAPADAFIWRIQGRRGGEDVTDPLRGPYNEGGLFGERQGWHKSLDDAPEWKPATLPEADQPAGVIWYRTEVALDLPQDQDTSVGLEIKDPPGRHYRASIFVNGWQMGNYVSDVGPQHRFPIPYGVLNQNGTNSISIAVWNTDKSGGGLGEVSLLSYGTFKSPREEIGH